MQIQSAIVLQTCSARKREVSILTHQGAALHGYYLIGECELDRAITLEGDTIELHGKLSHAQAATQQHGLFERATQSRLPIERGAPGNAPSHIRRQERVDIKIGKLQIYLCRHIALQ